MSRYKLSIPDRWLEYTSVGKQIDETPFLAFKVPLKETFFNNVSPEQKFSPSDLIELVPNLSLVIDLTNTQKYYSGNEFRGSGIEYKKIFCPGHQIPPNKLIRKFFDIVDDFMRKTSGSNSKDEVRLIGVHCTHGINRTGFFICSYMINKLGYNSEKAIMEFNSARGHAIERENYLNALKGYDINPLQFQPSQSNSTERVVSGDDIDDCPITQKSHRRQYSSEGNTNGYAYRSARNDYRNRWHNPAVFGHQSYQRDFNFYEDYPVDRNARWHNHQRPFVVNQPVLESVDPYFHSVQRKKYGNGRNRKY